jgi:hypothetical protein
MMMMAMAMMMMIVDTQHPFPMVYLMHIELFSIEYRTYMMIILNSKFTSSLS